MYMWTLKKMRVATRVRKNPRVRILPRVVIVAKMSIMLTNFGPRSQALRLSTVQWIHLNDHNVMPFDWL